MRSLVVLLAAFLLVARAEDVIVANQAGTAITPNTWTTITFAGATIDVPGWEFLHYVPALKKHCVLGNYQEVSGEPNRAWICYDAARNFMTVYDISGYWHSEHWPDAGHPVGGYAVDPTTSIAMGLCCNSGSQVSEGNQRRWTWQYDFISQAGRAKKSNATLDNAMQMGGAFDPLNNKLVVEGGDSGFIGTSEYDPAANTWNVGASCTATASNCPTPGAINPRMAYRTVDGKVYLFGGANDDSVYVYTTSTHTWVKKTTASGSRPTTRQAQVWVYLPYDDKFFLYGGAAAVSGDGLNDAWLYDPVADIWTSLSLSSPPSVSAGANPWDRGSYDPDMDLIVNMRNTRGITTVSVVRLRAGVNVGYLGTPTYTPTSGGVNRNSGTYARSPGMAVSGSTVYQGWAETTTTVGNKYEHIFARSVTGGTPTNLGSTITAISNNTLNNDGVSMAVIATVPWVCWEEVGSGGATTVWAKGFSGGAWSLGGQVDSGISGACSIVSVGGVPHVAYTLRSASTGEIELWVKKYVASSWSAVGSRLNVNSTNSRAGTPSIVSDGTNPCVAWDEYQSTSLSTSLVYVYCWNGSSAWVAKGTSVTSASYAMFPSLTYAGALFVGYIDRSASGHAQLIVKTWGGSSWGAVGSALNRDTNTGWAFRPKLATDGTNVYAAWVEQSNTQSQGSLAGYSSFGQRPQVYVSKWNTSSWSNLGASLNADTALGSASQPVIDLVSGAPVVVWGEVVEGAPRNIYSAQWDGSNWGALSVPTCVITTVSFPNATSGSSYSQTATQSGCGSSSWAVASGSLPSWASLNSSTGAITGTASGSGTATFTLSYDTATSGSLTITTTSSSMTITTSSPLPQGLVSIAYSQTMAASGGAAPLVWSVSAGSVPTGLSLSSGGVLSGTPTTSVGSPFSFTALVTDNNSITDSKAFSLTIVPGTVKSGGSSKSGGNSKKK
jgi:hypothetical protein